MTVSILIGDCRDMLRTMPDESVHCVVTSPPYWGLRDYGISGQLGLEKSLGEHLETMVSVFREVRRVLKPEGVCWVNYGDCYATSVNGRSAADTKALGNDDRTFRDKPFSTIGPVLIDVPGDALRHGKSGNKGGSQTTPGTRVAAGGYLKPKDLCMVPARFALAMQEDGWWLRSAMPWLKRNAMPESITDRPASAIEYLFMFVQSPRYFYDAAAVRTEAKYTGLLGQDASGYKDAKKFNGKHGSTLQGGPHGRHHLGDAIPEKERRDDKQRGHSRRHAGFNDRWDKMSKQEQQSTGRNFRNCDLFFESLEAPHGLIHDGDGTPIAIDVPPIGFAAAHFATFPPNLIAPLIRSSCPTGGTVLDPFGGAGTTGLVADRLQRNAILIELNPDYAEMAKARCHGDAPMFAEVVVA